MSLFDHIKRWVHAEFDIESRIEVDFVECLLYKPLLRLTDFVYEVIDLLVIFRLNLLLRWSGDYGHGVLFFTNKFVHLLHDLIWLEIN